MIRLLAVPLVCLAVLPNLGFAEEVVPPGHSTVHIVFVVPQTQQSMQFGFAADTSVSGTKQCGLMPEASPSSHDVKSVPR